MNSSILSIKNISKSFAKIDDDSITHAISNINIDLKENEFVSIVGPSGCGKSTILRLIAGLIFPTMGEIFLENKKIQGPNRDIGMVFQKPTLFPWLTVKKNISFGLDINNEYEENKINEMIKMIGLNDFANDYPGQLSGGMAQRVAIARAIINNPKVLLLDEPLGALDYFTRMNMQDEILEIWKEKKQLIIMVTHDIEEAIYMSTKVYVMEKNPGRIKEEVKIDLPYDRDRTSLEFVEYKNRILNLVKF